MDSLKDWLWLTVMCMVCSTCVALITKEEPYKPREVIYER